MRQYRNIVMEAACNLNCDYCPRPRISPTLDVPRAIRDLDRIIGRFNRNETCFRVECFGEITLYPDIVQYLEKKACDGYRIEVLSNGTRAMEVIKEETRLRWIFSLDGHTVEMNKHRHLSPSQVVNVLSAIMRFAAEIQCVFLDQSIEQMNDFIDYLQRQAYGGFLHIFPARVKGTQLSCYLDYDRLSRSDFIPDAEYFRRWKHIHERGERDFTCDYLTNGYTYRVGSDEIRMVKCDCSAESESFEHAYGDEKLPEGFPCGICITHFEYNNSRAIVNQ